MLSLLYLVVKAQLNKLQQYFVTSSGMFLNEKTVLEVWLNPRFEETGHGVQVYITQEAT